MGREDKEEITSGKILKKILGSKETGWRRKKAKGMNNDDSGTEDQGGRWKRFWKVCPLSFTCHSYNTHAATASSTFSSYFIVGFR